MRYNCLIIDDEEVLSQSTCEYFNMFDVHTAWVTDAQSCLRFFHEHNADLILLDINLVETSGFDLCKKLRQSMDVPILFISARQSDDDKLLALSIGGDDYIQKPYSLSVLLAKVKVVLRRARAALVMPLGSNGMVFDVDNRSIIINGRKADLKWMEFKLLSYLIENRGRVINKEEIFQNVWRSSITGDNTLNVHIRRLREKLEENPNDPKLIKTVWGTGYVFEGTSE